MSWKHSLLIQAADGSMGLPLSCLLPDTQCRNVAHNCLAELSSFSMEQINKVSLFK